MIPCGMISHLVLRGVIQVQMRLGDLLVRAKLVTAAQVAKALELQGELGGRVGDHLVALGAISQAVLDSF